MRLGATVVLGVACVLALRAPARADGDSPASTRAVIDRVDLEPSTLDGLRLRVAMSALSLQGQIVDLPDAKSFRLLVNGGKLEAPLAIGSWSTTGGGELAIVVVLEANAAYADALPAVLQTFDDAVLDKLNADHTQLAVLTFGDGVGAGKLSGLKAGRGKLGGVSADTSTNDPALSDTLDRALLLLKKAKNPEGKPLRKLVILIGDGRDRAGDRERVTKLGQRAAKEGVRIHSFGYAPNKVLRSLLTLGELSKRSLGTFRWVRGGGAESWGPAFAQLHDEILKQYVLTFFVDKASPPAGKLKIVAGHTETTSNELAIPEPSCDGTACPTGYCVAAACVLPRGPDGHGVVGWILMIVGIGVGVVVVLGVVGWLIQRQRVPMPMPMPGQLPGQPVQPGVPAQFGSQPPGSQPPGKRGWFKSKPPSQPPAPALPAQPQLPTTGPALLVQSGPLAGQRFGLINGFTVGKAANAHLVIDDGYTSTHHAQVTVEAGGVCRLYDLQSTNGTYANGVRVTHVELEHGMAIRIGSTDLRFLAQ
jgi:hypothetical protein